MSAWFKYTPSNSDHYVLRRSSLFTLSRLSFVATISHAGLAGPHSPFSYPTSQPLVLKCTEATKNSANAFWRSDQPGAEQGVNFETVRFANGTISACYPLWGSHVNKRAIPPISVDAKYVDDIQDVVTFAQSIVVKNTIHYLMGRSCFGHITLRI